MAPEEATSEDVIDSLSLQQRVNSARGYKAFVLLHPTLNLNTNHSRTRALHNPRVSDEQKEHAALMLEKLDEEGVRQEIYRQQGRPKSRNRVATGLRA
ncbi:hypothetical protein BDV06DRAFT_205781 [Aspergillus oleicola]